MESHQERPVEDGTGASVGPPVSTVSKGQKNYSPQERKEEHLIALYLLKLHRIGKINQLCFQRLQDALLPLKERFPQITTVLTVTNELASSPAMTPLDLAIDESKRWNQDNSPIPDFDAGPAICLFVVTPKSDPTPGARDNILMLDLPGVTPDVQRYCPPELQDGLTYLYIILRMFRYQYEEEERARVGLATTSQL